MPPPIFILFMPLMPPTMPMPPGNCPWEIFGRKRKNEARAKPRM
jgi:hypothetical protein